MIDPSAVVHQCAYDHDDEQDGDYQTADESSVVRAAVGSLAQLTLVAHRRVDGDVALLSYSIREKKRKKKKNAIDHFPSVHPLYPDCFHRNRFEGFDFYDVRFSKFMAIK